MSRTIENLADCEVRAVIYVLNTIGTHSADIRQTIVSVCGKEAAW